jgi:thymidine kinase
LIRFRDATLICFRDGALIHFRDGTSIPFPRWHLDPFSAMAAGRPSAYPICMAKLYFYYATMNAGKSTALLQAAHNYVERGLRTLLFTARIDRSHGKILSRIGISAQAHLFDPQTDFYTPEIKGSADCILIDEAQFLTVLQVRQLARLVDEVNVPVMCYGLRTDFRGELFPGSAQLLAWADSLIELKTICFCGRKATMVVRVGRDGVVEKEGLQVEIGGNERYVPFCRKHFFESIESGRCVGPAFPGEAKPAPKMQQKE